MTIATVMPLVEYSDSETSQPDTGSATNDHRKSLPKPLKRKRSKSSLVDLPPLPDTFHDLYVSSSRTSTHDDPALHGGRQRVTPHMEGCWPSHVYVEWYPSSTESNKLDEVIKTLNKNLGTENGRVQSLLKSELGAELPLHISLSRSLMLETNQRQTFIDTLKDVVLVSQTKPFDIHVERLEWVPNFENTRWFLVLKLGKPIGNGLNALLWAANHTAALHDKPSLYAPPASTPRDSNVRGRGRQVSRSGSRGGFSRSEVLSPKVQPRNWPDCSSSFHISIAWSLEPPSAEVIDRMRSIDISSLQQARVTVKGIKAKVGNVITAIALATQLPNTGGILG